MIGGRVSGCVMGREVVGPISRNLESRLQHKEAVAVGPFYMPITSRGVGPFFAPVSLRQHEVL